MPNGYLDLLGINHNLRLIAAIVSFEIKNWADNDPSNYGDE